MWLSSVSILQIKSKILQIDIVEKGMPKSECEKNKTYQLMSIRSFKIVFLYHPMQRNEHWI